MVRELRMEPMDNSANYWKTRKRRRGCKLAPGPRQAFPHHVSAACMVRGLREVWEEHRAWSRRVHIEGPDGDCSWGGNFIQPDKSQAPSGWNQCQCVTPVTEHTPILSPILSSSPAPPALTGHRNRFPASTQAARNPSPAWQLE